MEADKGYHSDGTLQALEAAGQESYLPEPKRKRNWKGKTDVQEVVQANREPMSGDGSWGSSGRRRRSDRWRTCTGVAGCDGWTCGGARTFASGC